MLVLMQPHVDQCLVEVEHCLVSNGSLHTTVLAIAVKLSKRIHKSSVETNV